MKGGWPGGIIPAAVGEGTLGELARAFAALGSRERLRILGLLLRNGRAGCEEIAGLLDLSQPAISYHLGVLEGAGLISRERRGRHLCITLTPRLGELLEERTIHQLREVT